MTQPLTRQNGHRQRTRIAETAFISDSKIADFRLEYFTQKKSTYVATRQLALSPS